jgi:hypothetical protein
MDDKPQPLNILRSALKLRESIRSLFERRKEGTREILATVLEHVEQTDN